MNGAERVCRPCRFYTAAESSVRRPETCPKMMLKLVHLLGVLVCGSQGRDCAGERADSLSLWWLCGQVECMFVFLSFFLSFLLPSWSAAGGERGELRGRVAQRGRGRERERAGLFNWTLFCSWSTSWRGQNAFLTEKGDYDGVPFFLRGGWAVDTLCSLRTETVVSIIFFSVFKKKKKKKIFWKIMCCLFFLSAPNRCRT